MITFLLVLLALASTAGAGLELDATRLRKAPALLRSLVGLAVANIVVVPVAGYLVLRALPLPEDVRIALLVIALAPGGATSPLVARIAGGEPTRVAAGYVLLALLSAVLAFVAAAVSDATPPLAHLAGVVAVQIVPLAMGAALRASRPHVAARIAPAIRKASSILLGLVVVALAITRGGALVTLGVLPALAMAILVAVTFVAGAAMAPAPRVPDAILTAVRNLTLALLLVEVRAPGGRGTLVVATYGLVMYAVAALIAAGARRRASLTAVAAVGTSRT